MLVEPPTDTLLRYRGSVANHAWRSPFAPECFGVESSLRGRLDSGRMRSFTDGVCIKLLTRLRHRHCIPFRSDAADSFPVATHAIRAPRAASPPCLGRTHSAPLRSWCCPFVRVSNFVQTPS